MSVHASSRSASNAIKSVLASQFVALASAVLMSGWVSSAVGRETVEPSQEAVVALPTLPVQAQRTHALILAGGPFPYPEKDATVFGNREQLLLRQRRGYYREYTVKTPGVRHRGARRIVCGGLQPTNPEACYYTADHYASFARIVQ